MIEEKVILIYNIYGDKMNCIFCKIINGEIPSYTLYEDEYVKCFLDVNPVEDAHTLIIPKKHFIDVTDIEDEYLLKIFEASRKIISLIQEKTDADGFVLTQNNGSVEEVKHYHLHVIPNYKSKKKTDIEEVYKLLTK